MKIEGVTCGEQSFPLKKNIVIVVKYPESTSFLLNASKKMFSPICKRESS